MMINVCPNCGGVLYAQLVNLGKSVELVCSSCKEKLGTYPRLDVYQLAACPCCDSEAAVVTSFERFDDGSCGVDYRVQCKECKTTSDKYNTPEAAVYHWNLRSKMDELKQQDNADLIDTQSRMLHVIKALVGSSNDVETSDVILEARKLLADLGINKIKIVEEL